MKLGLVDAFTDRAFAGNPAAVCLLEQEVPAAGMQSVARELGFSETAFLRPLSAGYELRWFTPTVEVDLCGHATLASAHFLWETRLASEDAAIRFESRSGPLFARRRAPGIELDFPAEPPEETPPFPALASALGVEPRWTGRNRLDFLLLLENEAAVRAVRPDFRAVAAATGSGRGVIVTSPSASPDFDFVSRYFAPAAGIDEDPATGSAHCCLGPFWAERLQKNDFRAFQASLRGGRLTVRVEKNGRVAIGGSAVTVFRGDLVAPFSE